MKEIYEKILWILFGIPLIVILYSLIHLLLAFLLKYVWNEVMPYVFGLPTLDWWQSFCLLLVSTLLIGNIKSAGNSK